ncbi:MAG: hypothetical protein IPF99_31015 [Deltaproteobacteria bacterium]|nr:hypothetical protein [Deltaproteobacteria bacterium]
MTTSERLNPGPTAEARASELYREHDAAVTQRTDRMFAALLGAQWLVAIVLSLVVSPYAWEGSQRSVHLHVWAAVVLGGCSRRRRSRWCSSSRATGSPDT